MSGLPHARISSQNPAWLSRLPAFGRRRTSKSHRPRLEALASPGFAIEPAAADDAAHESLQLLAQLQTELVEAKTLGELRSLLPALEAEGASAVAAAVLYHLLCRLEPAISAQTPAEDVWPLLRERVSANRLNQLFEQGFALYALSRPCLAAEGRDSVRSAALMAGLSSSPYLLAALLAHTASESWRLALWNMIEPCADPGLFAIRFPGQAPVLTTLPSAAERLIYAHAGREGFWPVLLEKAATCLTRMLHTDAGEGPLPQLQAALELLSGRPAETLDTAMTPVGCLRRSLAVAIRLQRPTVAAANEYPWLRQEDAEAQGLAYAVIDYDEDSDCVVLLRASGQPMPIDGRGVPLPGPESLHLRVPVEAFATYFSHIAAA